MGRLVLVFDLLGGCVVLLLPLLGASPQPINKTIMPCDIDLKIMAT